MQFRALKRSVNRIMRTSGNAMTLTRSGEGTTIGLKGKRLMGAAESIGNTAAQQAFRVRIGTAELDASAWASKEPKATGDTLTVDGRVRAIVDVQPLTYGNGIAGYVIECEG